MRLENVVRLIKQKKKLFPELATGGFFANLSFVNVLYILIFSWFVLQLAASTGFPHLPEMSGITVKSGKSVNSLELT